MLRYGLTSPEDWFKALLASSRANLLSPGRRTCRMLRPAVQSNSYFPCLFLVNLDRSRLQCRECCSSIEERKELQSEKKKKIIIGIHSYKGVFHYITQSVATFSRHAGLVRQFQNSQAQVIPFRHPHYPWKTYHWSNGNARISLLSIFFLMFALICTFIDVISTISMKLSNACSTRLKSFF